MVPQIPISLPFFFVAKLLFAAEEASQSHTIGLECTKPDGTRSPVSGVMPLSLQLNPQNLTGDIKAVAIATMGMVFDAPGAYLFHFMVDQYDTLTRPLNVIKIPQGASSFPIMGSGPCPQPSVQSP